jgi:tryptophan-rich sensory protein
MAIALSRVWNLKENTPRRQWFFAFGIQLLFNVLWAILFFTLHGVSLSIAAIVILWFAVAVLTLDSYEFDMFTFWLLLPYFAWVTFAVILDIAIWWVN